MTKIKPKAVRTLHYSICPEYCVCMVFWPILALLDLDTGLKTVLERCLRFKYLLNGDIFFCLIWQMERVNEIIHVKGLKQDLSQTISTRCLDSYFNVKGGEPVLQRVSFLLLFSVHLFK